MVYNDDNEQEKYLMYINGSGETGVEEVKNSNK